MKHRAVFTGGHHSSSLLVAMNLRSKGWSIYWFGHKKSIKGDPNNSAEYIDVLNNNIQFYDLLSGKLSKKIDIYNISRFIFGIFQSLYLLVLLKPNVIVSFGGYLSVPVILAGKILGIKCVTHEQTVTLGLANRLVEKLCDIVFYTWPDTGKLIKNRNKFLTGLPIRNEFKSNKIASENIIFITAGKQGSHTINDLIFRSIDKFDPKYKVIHQIGPVGIFDDKAKAQNITNKNYSFYTYDFFRQIEYIKSSKVVVARAGAHTIYELAILGKRTVLIPIPWVSQNEQMKNAITLEKNGNAVILEEKDISVENLISSINKALKLKPSPMNLPLNATEIISSHIEGLISSNAS